MIDGEFYDPDTGHCDLEETFTVRDDDGEVFEIHGWMVDTIILEETRRLVMQVWQNGAKAHHQPMARLAGSSPFAIQTATRSPFTRKGRNKRVGAHRRCREPVPCG